MAIIHIPILLSRSKAVFLLFRGGAYHIIVATVVAAIHNIMSTSQHNTILKYPPGIKGGKVKRYGKFKWEII